jgi:glycosyltransferase involved in cell wall biosynthesis
MKKYRVTYLILNGEPYGGSEKHVVDIYNKLNKSKFYPSLLYSKGNPLINNVEDSTNCTATGRGFFDFFKILKAIKDQRPDVLHAHAARALIYARLIKFVLSKFFSHDMKLISTSHGLWVPKSKVKFGLHKLLHIFKDQDDLTLAVSKYSRMELINQGYKAEKVKYIYNGIDFELFNESRKVKDKVEKAIFVGRLTEQKGVSDLMNLILREYKEKSNIIFQIYGTGHLDEYINNFIRDYNLNNVDVKGHANNIEDVFSKSDILIAPSLDEGLPYTLVEAINCGIPIITTCVGGVPEIVEHEVNGFLVKPGNRDELYEALTKMKTTNIQSMSKESIRISQKFSLNLMVHNIESEYQEYLK